MTYIPSDTFEQLTKEHQLMRLFVRLVSERFWEEQDYEKIIGCANFLLESGKLNLKGAIVAKPQLQIEQQVEKIEKACKEAHDLFEQHRIRMEKAISLVAAQMMKMKLDSSEKTYEEIKKLLGTDPDSPRTD